MRLLTACWERQTRKMLRDPVLRDFTASGPWMDLAQRVPAKDVAAWWELIETASEAATPPASGDVSSLSTARYRPGVGKVRHVVYHLVLREDVPFDALARVPFGLFAEVLASLHRSAATGWLPEQVAQRINAAFGAKASSRLETVLWGEPQWHRTGRGCHHTLGSVLAQLAVGGKADVDLCVGLDRRFKSAAVLAVTDGGTAACDLRVSLRSGLSRAGADLARTSVWGLCRPDYRNLQVQREVLAAERAALAHPGFLPCPGAVVDLAVMFAATPQTVMAGLLLAGDTLEVEAAFQVAAALTD